MPDTVATCRYDLPWKAALTHALRAFLDFFFPERGKQIDWTKRPRFRDKELAGISFGGTPDGMVADKLVEVCLRDGSLHWVLIHIEVQAQRDTSLARRILDYNYRIFTEYAQPVANFVVLADEDLHWRPRAFHNEVLGTVMGISFVTAKLIDYAEKADELQASHNPFAWLTLAHLRAQQARHQPDQLYAAKWQLTKLLYQHGWGKQRIIVLFKVINWMMALPDSYQQRYWQAVLDLEKERNVDWITPLEQSFMDKGREQGIKQGREQGLESGKQLGRKEEALTLLERQLTRRFGELPSIARTKLTKASLAELEAWCDALPEAASLETLLK
ncbi:DUF4351 domain-containing protein [Duganella callida]|uniref:DUF4351 domain-containing protein n=1 Tax=Duganella callida TaxID=2561932 RepID=A0A4Y9SAX2_9BURK|nr:DUF4351 domain-containing protein [Duganella callida]TFW19169.1 DUF4351 domain-containing protein [Duganella callida]